MATVSFAAVAAIVVTPAAIVLLGARLDSLDVRQTGPSDFPRPDPVPKPIEQKFWYRSTKFVMRRAVPIGLAIVALLLVLGVPFLGVKWGFPDDRVLPQSLSAHQVGDELRTNFADDSATAVTVVVPDADRPRRPRTSSATPPSCPGARRVRGDRTQRHIRRRQAGRAAVDGHRSRGRQRVPDGGQHRAAVLATPPRSNSTGCTRSPRPDGQPVQFTGVAQINRDSVEAITSRLPMVLGVIAVITFVLLFLLTGSVVLPLKALVLNVLSLTAAFGALVWIFQDGHLGALGTTPTGTLVANLPVLLFCIAFGLSMDYEVFLVSRIREYWLKSGERAGEVRLLAATTTRASRSGSPARAGSSPPPRW